jgi:hypothetical protein
MNSMMRSVALALGCLTVSASHAAAIDGTEPVICALAETMECVPNEACHRVSAVSIGAPRFLRINFADGQITKVHPGGEGITTSIERSEVVEGKLILQGAEEGIEGVRDGLGWSLAIDQTSGNMVLTGAGDDVAFVIFGACTALP